MKKLALFVLLIAGVLILPSCQEKDPEATPQPRGGSFTIKVTHQFGGQDLDFEAFKYQSAAGDSMQIDLLNHYISSFQFHSPETGWKSVDVKKLIRSGVATSHTFDIKDLPFGNYDSIRFAIGLDSATNHDINQVGELDPGYGMIWTWNSGYIFYMFEGKFRNSQGNILPFAYHIGGDNYLMSYQLPLANIKTLSSTATQANIELRGDLAEIFSSPHLIELNNVPLVSHTMDQPALTTQLKENLLDAWTAH